MKYIFTAALFLISITLNADLRQGFTFLQSGQFDKAKSEFNKEITANSSNASAYYGRGLANLYLGEFEDAVKDFDSSIKLDKNNADSYNSRGLAKSYMGELDGAHQDFNKAISLDPQFGQAYVNRASYFMATRELDKALADLNKAEKFVPGNPEIYLQRGRINYFNENAGIAIKDFEKAISLGIRDAETYYNLANAYYKTGGLDNAIKYYSKVLEKDPKNVDALNNRALAYVQTGQSDLADADRAKLDQINSELYPELFTGEMQTVSDSDNIVSIKLPQSWHISNSKGEGYDEIIVSKEKIDPKSEALEVGVTIGIMTNVSKFYPVNNEQELLDFWQGSQNKNTEEYLIYEMLLRKHAPFGGHPSLTFKVLMQASKGHVPMVMLQRVITRGDNLIYVYMQAPEKLFPVYEKLFQKSLETIKISDSLPVTYN